MRPVLWTLRSSRRRCGISRTTTTGDLWVGSGFPEEPRHFLQHRQTGQFPTFELPADSGPVVVLRSLYTNMRIARMVRDDRNRVRQPRGQEYPNLSLNPSSFAPLQTHIHIYRKMCNFLVIPGGKSEISEKDDKTANLKSQIPNLKSSQASRLWLDPGALKRQ